MDKPRAVDNPATPRGETPGRRTDSGHAKAPPVTARAGLRPGGARRQGRYAGASGQAAGDELLPDDVPFEDDEDVEAEADEPEVDDDPEVDEDDDESPPDEAAAVDLDEPTVLLDEERLSVR